MCYTLRVAKKGTKRAFRKGDPDPMRRVRTLTKGNLKNTVKNGGCGECQTSCQSACKTSCTVGNQSCEQTKTR